MTPLEGEKITGRRRLPSGKIETTLEKEGKKKPRTLPPTSFERAFAEARERGDETFPYKDGIYNTKIAPPSKRVVLEDPTLPIKPRDLSFETSSRKKVVPVPVSGKKDVYLRAKKRKARPRTYKITKSPIKAALAFASPFRKVTKEPGGTTRYSISKVRKQSRVIPTRDKGEDTVEVIPGMARLGGAPGKRTSTDLAKEKKGKGKKLKMRNNKIYQ